jgi:hypothetical protein
MPARLAEVTPSTDSSVSPRRTPAASAGDPGSTSVTAQMRGVAPVLRDQVMP